MQALPFSCVRPAPEHAAEVAALPYDVFDRAEAAAYVRTRPLSFLNIDRPETQFGPEQDMYAPEVYERARELFEERVADGTYVTDAAQAYYLYELTQGGRSQTGLVCCCSVDEYLDGTIKRHENTRPEKERDRIAHIEALGAQTGPIFLTYRDSMAADVIIGAAKGATPLYDFTDDEGVRQRVWRVARPEAVEALKATFEAIPCAYIADGHHRAASAVRVAERMRAANPGFTGSEPYNRFLAVLFPASQLEILAYNRVVSDLAGRTPGQFVEALGESGFEAERAGGAVVPEVAGTFGLYVGGAWWLVRMGEALAAEVAAAGPVGSLDCSMLQDRVLEPLLGIHDPKSDPRIAFVGGIRGTDELERRAGAEGAAFSMYPTSVGQLLAVADAGLLMPPKSTWFEPKLRSGLFVHRIR